MSKSSHSRTINKQLPENLTKLKLGFICENYSELALTAEKEEWTYTSYLERLIQGEADRRSDRAVQRKIKAAKFPVIKTIDSFDWRWPKKINKLQVKDFFRLEFIEEKQNLIFLAGVGLGKSHIASALGYEACLQGYTVLFAPAIEVINSLVAAKKVGNIKNEIKRFLKPNLLILDEIGYLPIDKIGANLLFQVISRRYETGSIIITTNRAYKDWAEIFCNDSTLASAILDRILHHSHTALIEGPSYRTKK